MFRRITFIETVLLQGLQPLAALGIKERENYNKPKNPNSKKLVCPPDKMAAIQEALRHFKMI